MTDSFPRAQARTQRFTLGTPRTFTVSPDGSRALFLRSASGTDPVHRLYSVDAASGAETCVVDPSDVLGAAGEQLSAQEKARRERTRTQGGGVVAYACDRALTVAAVMLSGRLFVADLVGGAVTELAAQGPVIDPRPNSAGDTIAYVSDGALRVIRTDGSGDREIAGRVEGEDHTVTWGVAEFIAAEEMGRGRGYWWSPDGQWLLAAHVDSSAVPQWHIGDPANPDAAVNTVRYPAAGTVNAEVGLALISLAGQRISVTWDHETYPYLAAVHWSANGAPLLAVQTRDQRELRVLSVDVATGATTTVRADTDERWVEIVPGTPAWTTAGEVVTVAADEDSYRLFLGDRAITEPGLQVRSVLEAGDDVVFSASADDPTQIHVFVADASGVRAVTTEPGVHGIARGGDTTVTTSWTPTDVGPVSLLRQGESAPRKITSVAEAPPLRARPQLLELGERKLRAALLMPTDHVPGTKIPVLLDPYGGPHAQRVLQVHNAFVLPQWLADQGFAVLVADGRGSPGRGPEWDRAIHHSLADVTLQDQVDALSAAAQRFPDLDTSRVAMRGWSYGGYLSALAVLRRPDVFHAGIAGAPVTDWALYDTHYTERYLGHPHDNPQVYQRNSLIEGAEKLEGELLIIHGLADDNVFAAHGLRLSAALLRAGRAHSMIPMPGVTHMSPTDEVSAENFLLFQLDWLRRALAR